MSDLIIPRSVATTLTAGVISVNSFTGVVSLSTDSIPEKTNLYFTTTRARSAFSVDINSDNAALDANNGLLTYSTTTGVLTLCADVLNYRKYTFVVRDANGDIYSRIGRFTTVVATTLSTTNLSVDYSIKSSVLVEAPTVSGQSIICDTGTLSALTVEIIDNGGSTITIASPIQCNGLITSQGGIQSTGTLEIFGELHVDGVSGIPYFDANTDTNVRRADTDDLSEGSSNLYFTSNRVKKTQVGYIDTSLTGLVTTEDELSAAISKLSNRATANYLLSSNSGFYITSPDGTRTVYVWLGNDGTMHFDPV